MIWWPDSIPTLRAGSTTLRPMRPSDAEDIFRAVQDPEIPKFTTVPSEYPVELAIEFATTRNVASHTNKTELVFVIENSDLAGKNIGELLNAGSAGSAGSDKYFENNSKLFSNGFCGVISLHSIDIPNHRAEIGYWMAKEARGRAIGTTAAELITEYGLITMGFRRIDGIVDVRNEGSKKLLMSAGYEYEGIMKSYVTRRDGTQLDMALFAATKS